MVNTMGGGGFLKGSSLAVDAGSAPSTKLPRSWSHAIRPLYSTMTSHAFGSLLPVDSQRCPGESPYLKCCDVDIRWNVIT